MKIKKSFLIAIFFVFGFTGVISVNAAEAKTKPVIFASCEHSALFLYDALIEAGFSHEDAMHVFIREVVTCESEYPN